MNPLKLIPLLLLFIHLPLNALAELPDQIKNDFSPLSGTIIMPVGEHFLVDLDATSGLQEGDIFTLIAKGEQVVHPVTKEVLGTLDVVRGYLQVTQIKSGYSYAKLISAQTTPQKGDQVKRFEQVTAAFEKTADTTTLANELKLALPHLVWSDKGPSEKTLLTFTLNGDKLLVTNSEQATLKSYQFTEGQLSAPLGIAYQPSNFAIGEEQGERKTLLNQGVDNLLGVVGFGKKDKRLENPGIVSNQQKNSAVWIGHNLDGNPVGLTVGDFDGDGAQETAVAMEDHLQIHRMTDGKLKLITTIDFPGGVHLLSLDSIDLDNNDLPELYLSANVGPNLSSQVVEYTQGQYRRVINQIPWFLRVVTLPKLGPVLIAQSMGEQEKPFSRNPFRVLRSANKLSRGDDLPLPSKINLFSYVPMTGAANDLLYAHVNTNDYLHVSTPKGTTLWSSADHFGGTEVSFYNIENVADELIQPVYIPQRLLPLPSGELLAPQNDGPRALQRFRNFTKSRVIAMKWDGFALIESWRTADQEGYLADFTLADADNDGQDELVMVVKYSHKNLLQKGRSTVVMYELDH